MPKMPNLARKTTTSFHLAMILAMNGFTIVPFRVQNRLISYHCTGRGTGTNPEPNTD